MNRTFKFRAYVPTSFDDEGTPSKYEMTEDLAFEDYEPINELLSLFQSPIMQFVGLKDKNGTDIFEGDIMNVQLPMGGFWGNVQRTKIGQVVYEPDYGAYLVKWEWSKNQHHVHLNCDIALQAEIIGNIHEHTNLLTHG